NRARAGCRLEQACPHPVTTLLRACHPLHCPRWDSLHYPFLRGILDRDDDLQSIQGILRHDWTKPLFAISLWRCSCLHPSMQFRFTFATSSQNPLRLSRRKGGKGSSDQYSKAPPISLTSYWFHAALL